MDHWLTGVNMLYSSLLILQVELDQDLQLQSMDQQESKYLQVLLASSLLGLGFSLLHQTEILLPLPLQEEPAQELQGPPDLQEQAELLVLMVLQERQVLQEQMGQAELQELQEQLEQPVTQEQEIKEAPISGS